MVITHNKSYSLTADLRCRNVGVPPEDSDGVGVRSERLAVDARGKAGRCSWQASKNALGAGGRWFEFSRPDINSVGALRAKSKGRPNTFLWTFLVG